MGYFSRRGRANGGNYRADIKPRKILYNISIWISTDHKKHCKETEKNTRGIGFILKMI